MRRRHKQYRRDGHLSAWGQCLYGRHVCHKLFADGCGSRWREIGLDWREYVRQDAALLRPAEVDHLVGNPEKARQQLERLGVEVMTNAMVTSLSSREVCIGDRTIPTRTVLWAAGVQASPLARSLGVPLDRAGRVIVNGDLTIPNHDDVYVIGDLAAIDNVPGVAPAAIQEGTHAARNIERALAGKSRQRFRYRDKPLPTFASVD